MTGEERHLDRVTCERIKAYMKAEGLSQQALAEKIDTTQPNVSSMLNGKRAVGADTLRRIALALSRPTYELMGLSPSVDLPASDYATLAEHLGRLKVPRDDVFVQLGYFSENPDRKSVGTNLSICNIRGSIGAPPEKLVMAVSNANVQLPPYIVDELAITPVRGKDGNKVALLNWWQQPIDVDDGRMHFEVAPIKYRTKLAARAQRGRIVEDLIDGRLQILGDSEDSDRPRALFPCHLHCDGLILTGDSKVLLAQRSSSVDIEPMQWQASFGESMDWDIDVDASGSLHPYQTIVRGMHEELGLSQDWIQERFGYLPTLSFLDLVFQMHNIIYTLICLIELPALGISEALDRARNHRIDMESRAFASMDFTPESCADAIVTGKVEGRKLTDCSRLTLMSAAISKFGSGLVNALSVKP